MPWLPCASGFSANSKCSTNTKRLHGLHLDQYSKIQVQESLTLDSLIQYIIYQNTYIYIHTHQDIYYTRWLRGKESACQ